MSSRTTSPNEPAQAGRHVDSADKVEARDDVFVERPESQRCVAAGGGHDEGSPRVHRQPIDVGLVILDDTDARAGSRVPDPDRAVPRARHQQERDLAGSPQKSRKNAKGRARVGVYRST